MSSNKEVTYNGSNLTYYSCTDPTFLVVGKKYTVISEIDRGWQTDFCLQGVEGSFNSTWFNEVSPKEEGFVIER